MWCVCSGSPGSGDDELKILNFLNLKKSFLHLLNLKNELKNLSRCSPPCQSSIQLYKYKLVKRGALESIGQKKRRRVLQIMYKSMIQKMK